MRRGAAVYLTLTAEQQELKNELRAYFVDLVGEVEGARRR
jgi:hypothetical protein